VDSSEGHFHDRAAARPHHARGVVTLRADRRG
jgi:hypothetical protein